MKKPIIIGVLGGMGTYATIHLFRQYAEIFSAEKEWERPRIIIDNRCTMPSRVRAFLYNENVDVLINEMTESLQGLLCNGCNRIILACNTSHIFLPEIYKRAPQLENNILSLIDICVEKIHLDKISNVFLLASEGTIDAGIYQSALKDKGIGCIVPQKNEYSLIRECIEAVKQNKHNNDIKNIFLSIINKYDNCILGCTELPILYDTYYKDVMCSHTYDPLLLALKKLKEEYDND